MRASRERTHRPLSSTCRRTRVRHPVPSGSSPGRASTSASVSTCAMRCSDSASTCRLSSRWCGSAMCPNSAPPARSAGSRSMDAADHTCARRCSLGSSTRTVSARQNAFLRSSVTRASHPLTWDRVGHEHHTAVVPRDRDAAVRDVGNVEFDRLSDCVTHPASLCTRRAADLRSIVRLYLASTSPARLATLRAAGIEPVLLEPERRRGCRRGRSGPLTPHDYVQLLARAKAEAVSGSTVDGAALDGFVLGGDSAFELDGVVYGKPHHPEVARERWRAMRGRVGLLHSGHWLIDHRGGSAGRGRRRRHDRVGHVRRRERRRARRRTSRPASRSRWRAASRSTRAAARSSSGSTATRTPSSACRCRRCGRWPRSSASPGRRSGPDARCSRAGTARSHKASRRLL